MHSHCLDLACEFLTVSSNRTNSPWTQHVIKVDKRPHYKKEKKKKTKTQKVSRSVDKSSDDKNTNTWHKCMTEHTDTRGSYSDFPLVTDNKASPPHQLLLPLFFFYFCHDMNRMRFFVYLKRERRGLGVGRVALTFPALIEDWHFHLMLTTFINNAEVASLLTHTLILSPSAACLG